MTVYKLAPGAGDCCFDNPRIPKNSWSSCDMDAYFREGVQLFKRSLVFKQTHQHFFCLFLVCAFEYFLLLFLLKGTDASNLQSMLVHTNKTPLILLVRAIKQCLASGDQVTPLWVGAS